MHPSLVFQRDTVDEVRPLERWLHFVDGELHWFHPQLHLHRRILCVYYTKSKLFHWYTLCTDAVSLVLVKSLDFRNMSLWEHVHQNVYVMFQGSLHRQLLFGCSLLFPILIYVKFYAPDQESALFNLGMFCSGSGIILYAAPFASMVSVPVLKTLQWPTQEIAVTASARQSPCKTLCDVTLRNARISRFPCYSVYQLRHLFCDIIIGAATCNDIIF